MTSYYHNHAIKALNLLMRTRYSSVVIWDMNVTHIFFKTKLRFNFIENMNLL